MISTGNNNWVPYTSVLGSTFQGYEIGICVSQIVLPGNNVTVQTWGRVPYGTYNVGAGSESYVSFSGNGLITRGTTGQIVGTCDRTGAVTLFGFHSNTNINTFVYPSGSTGQFYLTNSSSGSGWFNLSGDVANSVVTPGLTTVNGIQGSTLPSAATGCLNWTGSAWAFSSFNGAITWASDLSGNATTGNTNQYVSSLSYSSSASGGSISVKGSNTLLNWVTNAITLQQAGTTLVSLNGTSSDYISLSASPAASGLIRVPGASTNVITALSGGNTINALGFDATPNLFLSTFSAGQINFRQGSTNMAYISASAIGIPVNVVAPTVQADSPTSDASPNSLIIQAGNALAAAATNRTGADVIVTPGAGSTSNGTPGKVLIPIGTPSGSGSESAGVLIRRGAALIAQIGPLVSTGSSTGAVYLGNNITPSTTNYTINGTSGGNTNINTTATASFNVSNTSVAQYTSGAFQFSVPLSGNTNALQFGAVVQSVAGSGTTVLPPAKYQFPLLILNGSMTGGVTLTFPGASFSRSFWFIDTTGVTFNGNTLTINTGTPGTTVAVTSSNHTFFIVYAVDANNMLSIGT